MVLLITVMQKYTSKKYSGFSEFLNFIHILLNFFTLGYVLFFLVVEHSSILFYVAFLCIFVHF